MSEMDITPVGCLIDRIVEIKHEVDKLNAERESLIESLNDQLPEWIRVSVNASDGSGCIAPDGVKIDEIDGMKFGRFAICNTTSSYFTAEKAYKVVDADPSDGVIRVVDNDGDLEWVSSMNFTLAGSV